MLSLIQQQVLSLSGGATQTVFPAVESWLAGDGDRWNAFVRIRGRKSAERYHSVIDFLLCEVAPEHRGACLAFYDDRGPALRDLCTPGEVRALESRLMLFLVISYEAFCQKRRLSWRAAVELVDEVIARAA
jgi:hypothetical protein